MFPAVVALPENIFVGMLKIKLRLKLKTLPGIPLTAKPKTIVAGEIRRKKVGEKGEDSIVWGDRYSLHIT